ncbi:energy-coupling factor ABC transporter ATP-binding protein [Arthrobacter sp. I2-34]|uniref:Energy-coupling factor ABC transporter ATP-binding protein n=1 Tax=Arthrobacter hankyongi TaxID=2904801 RepID=A0ABS9L5Y0_9MICC|nr:ABC transporter ATP-binding protein [Arthrobacter hankyongi]MCG2622082.1 energy-coupling factor ABC transporter ATP-binding protein [Arthrobacter hankyongi]
MPAAGPAPGRDPDAGAQPRSILRGISAELTEQRVAVIGGNGSGKSTLLRLVNGLARPTSGQVRVNGLNPSTEGGKVRRQVGFVFTDPLSQLVMPTPREDVELSLRRVHRRSADRRRTAEEILAAYGLAALADNSIYELSGGERQLAALATVLAVNPAILVLDEPSTLLDLRNTQLLHRIFETLSQQLIMATHDLDFAAEFDRALVIHAGQAVFDGNAGDAVAFYRQLCADDTAWPPAPGQRPGRSLPAGNGAP